MTYFLTSSPCLMGEEAFTPANGFLEKISQAVKPGSRCLFIASSPAEPERTEGHGNAIRRCFAKEGIEFSEYVFLDDRNAEHTANLVEKADVIILAGGHVPTQNEFFNRIRLREALNNFGGVLMGISAGTMNSADIVYTHAELPGEAIDPEYKKFLPGLGITKAQVLPHYNMIKDDVLDGLRLFEDVACPDSIGHEFYVLPDGSYILGKDGGEWLCGEAYMIKDGIFSQLSKNGDIVRLK